MREKVKKIRSVTQKILLSNIVEARKLSQLPGKLYKCDNKSSSSSATLLPQSADGWTMHLSSCMEQQNLDCTEIFNGVRIRCLEKFWGTTYQGKGTGQWPMVASGATVAYYHFECTSNLSGNKIFCQRPKKLDHLLFSEWTT